MIKEAVILAAGMGTRLSDEMAGKPKGFIVFDRYPIIEESVRKLLKEGVEKIWIVTGYQRHNFENLTEKYPGNVQTVWNPEFENSGTMYSLYCVREYVKGSFLLLESDIIYEQKHFQKSLMFHPRNAFYSQDLPSQAMKFLLKPKTTA